MYRVAVCDDESGALGELCRLCGEELDGLGVEHRIVPFRSARDLLDAMDTGSTCSASISAWRA